MGVFLFFRFFLARPFLCERPMSSVVASSSYIVCFSSSGPPRSMQVCLAGYSRDSSNCMLAKLRWSPGAPLGFVHDASGRCSPGFLGPRYLMRRCSASHALHSMGDHWSCQASSAELKASGYHMTCQYGRSLLKNPNSKPCPTP